MEATVDEVPVAKVVGYGGRDLTGVVEEEAGATIVEVCVMVLVKVFVITASVVEVKASVVEIEASGVGIEASGVEIGASGLEVAGPGVTVTMTVLELCVVIVIV